ncbi:MAG: hypothetical protein JOZ61_06735 [Verrucomicrobia bacterium]|nr:hypothetical protein [Verrucomicrobiota bacterium]
MTVQELASGSQRRETLIRLDSYPQLRTFAGAPEFKGTPEEANAYYEKSISSLWLSHAAYPIFAGASQTKNLINFHPETEWGRWSYVAIPAGAHF